jgi:hypothetical protein
MRRILKRLLYGRRYSKPSDRWFQDYRWKAWEQAQIPKGGVIRQEQSTHVVIGECIVKLNTESREFTQQLANVKVSLTYEQAYKDMLILHPEMTNWPSG